MKMPDILEMANHRAKWSEIWDSGVVVTSIRGTFDLFGIQYHFGVIQCTLLKKIWATRKRLVVKRNGVKFGIWV